MQSLYFNLTQHEYSFQSFHSIVAQSLPVCARENWCFVDPFRRCFHAPNACGRVDGYRWRQFTRRGIITQFFVIRSRCLSETYVHQVTDVHSLCERQSRSLSTRAFRFTLDNGWDGSLRSQNSLTLSIILIDKTVLESKQYTAQVLEECQEEFLSFKMNKIPVFQESKAENPPI